MVRLLGKGGMGEVYLADEPRLGRRVALKVLAPELARDPQFVERFRREARAASALTHPNVCVVHEVGDTEDGCPFIAMEYVEGRTLLDRLEEGPIPVSQIVDIAIQVTDALDAAHSKRIVHRDIKAANVTLDPHGRVKLLDFGLAKRFGGIDGDSSLGFTTNGTHPGTVMGTPYAMSPEQAVGRTVDHRSDLFSVGVLIYQLCTGRMPFVGSNIGELTDRILHAQPEAMARFNYDLPVELERVVRKCLEKSPDRRYQSARELVVDLRNLRRDLEASSAAGALEDTAVVPAPAPPSVDEIPESDVFLSFASLDDQPLVAGKQGWISQFRVNLKVRLEQLSGESVRIWPQPNPVGRSETRPEVLERLPEARTLVSVVSPPFVRSEGCRGQVAAYWSAVEHRGRLEIERRPRVLKVVKSPVDPEELPQDVAPLLARLHAFEFFEWDPETGRLREYDETFGEVARERYHERIYDVAYELRQVLKRVRESDEAAGPTSPHGKVIYLAATTNDLAAQRDQLQRELVELGHDVVPQGALPIVASDLETAVRAYLEGCDIAIHLVGDRYGLVPEDTQLSVVAFQNRLAAEMSAETGLERFVWLPRGLTPRDERQQAFLAQLVRDPDAHRGAEVVSDTLENFKSLLRARWSRSTTSEELAGAAGRPPRVYVICDPRDERAIEPIEDALFARGVDVSLPGFEAAESEVQQVHIQNLRDCDGALIYYGAGGNHWVDFNIRDLEKAAGYRDAAPILARCVYVAPPWSHRKERFRSVSVEAVRQTGDAFDPALLEPFVRAVKEAKTASS